MSDDAAPQWSLKRWAELREIWDTLYSHEQRELIETARAMSAKRQPAPEPQSLRA